MTEPLLQLEGYSWKNRLLLVFAPALEEYQEQKRLLVGQEAGLKDRDLLVFYLGEESPAGIEALKGRFGVGEEPFLAVLVGKDGGAKGRFHKPVSADELFSLIDGMPMRQQEMKTKACG
ncbi:MAG: DUF4174 domain-containing protein [Deinococcota bacterium]|jgi:hypothetical protein|nr:DUF4174 domain-containing protein [Deinococcota bacterium]